MYKKFLPMILILAFLSSCITEQNYNQEQPLQRFEARFFDIFDTVISIIGYAPSQEDFDFYASTLETELLRLHKLFDIFHEYEGINNVKTINNNAGISPIEVDYTLINILTVSIEAYALTNGVLNIALGPVLSIWHEHRRHSEEAEATLPDVDRLLLANELTNIEDVIVDVENNTVFLRYEGMSLDLGAMAKGYALEVAAQMSNNMGFNRFLFSMGGDVLAGDPPPDRDFWNVAVTNPFSLPERPLPHVDVISAENLAVLSSGDYQRFFVVDGVHYNHIIDPRTLMPAMGFRSVTVLHTSAVMAEILTTVAFVLDIEETTQVLGALGGDVLWVLADGTMATTGGYSGFSREF